MHDICRMLETVDLINTFHFVILIPHRITTLAFILFLFFLFFLCLCFIKLTNLLILMLHGIIRLINDSNAMVCMFDPLPKTSYMVVSLS